MIKAIFFDLDNTLCNCTLADQKTYELIVPIVHKHYPAIHTTQLVSDYQLLIHQEPFAPNNQPPVREWRIQLWDKALQKQGVEDKILAETLHDFFYEERLKFYKFDPGVEDMLNALSLHYQLALITNGDSDIQRPKLTACNAYRFFQHILVGGEHDEEKPHISIFQKACDITGCKPKQAVHIGDSLKTDIQGGKNSGLALTIWINPLKKTLPLDAPVPDYQVASVLEVPNILKNI